MLASIELYAGYLYSQQKIMTVTSAIYLVDVITLVLQFFYHREYAREQTGGNAGIFSLLMTEKFFPFARVDGVTDAEHKKNFMKAKFEKHVTPTATKKFKDK